MDKILFKETQNNKILIIVAVLFSLFFGVFVINTSAFRQAGW